MFILLDQNRVPIGEITDYLSATLSVRFSSPGQIEMVISETSPTVYLLRELVHVYHVETQTLFLIDYLTRSIVSNNCSAITIKGITIEGFLEQRIVVVEKLLEGANLQASIKELFTENVISPEDSTRTLDFYSFVDSTDPIVLGVTAKGLVSGISVMTAITSLLDSNNLGYEVRYNLDTRLASFKIVAGRNLCDGFISKIHGPNLPNTVTLSVRSETLKDIRSFIDLSPYKTRVYVKNFDDMKTFNRGETKTGLELREGVLSTGHGNNGLIDIIIDPPKPPEIIVPDIILPPEIPIVPPIPDRRLLGLYVLTDKHRLLACAMYPGLPIPDIWFDVTPEPVSTDNIPLSAQGGTVIGSGDLVIMSEDRRKLFRASMVGGWFGTRYFGQAEQIFNAFDVDIIPELPSGPSSPEIRQGNWMPCMALDDVTGRFVAVITSPTYTWYNYHSFKHRLIDGNLYDLYLRPEQFVAGIVHPGYCGLWPTLSLRDNIVMISGMSSFFITSKIHVMVTAMGVASWQDKTTMLFGGHNSYHRSWHAHPVPGSDTVYVSNIECGQGYLLRSKDLLEGTNIDGVNIGYGWPGSVKFSPDGSKLVNAMGDGRLVVLTLPPTDLKDTTAVYSNQPVNGGQTFRQVTFAGIDDITGVNIWGVLCSGRTYDNRDSGVPSFYVTPNEDFTGMIDITPGLKTFLRFGPFGIDESAQLNEIPVYAWPILG